jgi:hypothetical protein
MKPLEPEQVEYLQARIHEDRRPMFIAINAVFLVVVLVSVALRFISRRKIGTHLGLDDWLIALAAVGSTN